MSSTSFLTRLKSLLLLCIVSLFLSFSLQAAEFEEGKDYMLLANPGIPSVPGKIEVREFFWYGCSHCYTLQGYIIDWKKRQSEDVNFVLTPALAADHWKLLGTAYFAAENLGVAEKSHDALFDYIHKDRNQNSTPEAAAVFYEQYGVKKDELLNQMNSFTVKTEMRKAESLFRQYQLTGTPAIVVNGKYVPASRSYPEMLRIVDFLVEKERREGLSGAAK